ncbi:MAG: AbrB/MazE/SpoVT family DNA-binding domain-containing protein [Gammaproteobacteria bacterium]
MKVAIVPIGNSKGIRLPKAVLAQCGLENQAELQVQDGQIVIRSLKRSRAGWEEAFTGMHERGDDALLDADVSSTSNWDRSEWHW